MPPVRRGEKSTREAVAAHRAVADRVLDKQVVLPMKYLYAQEAGKVSRAMRRAMQGKLKVSSAGRDGYHALNRALDVQSRRTAARLVQELVHAQRSTTGSSADALADYVGRMLGRTTALDNDAVRQKIMYAQRKALEGSQAENASRMTAGVHQRLVLRLNDEVQKGATVGQAITAVSEELDNQWWQVERLARTEASRAFNSGQVAGVAALSDEVPGILMRWTERVDDFTGKPMDNRVAPDSMEMHGQVVPVGGLFAMPTLHAAWSSKLFDGKTWEHPPNRPNDRAVVLPWAVQFGTPSYKLRGGKRVNIASAGKRL